MMRFSPVRLELSLLSIHNNFSASLEIQHVTGKGRLTLCFSITHVSCVECCEADECSILDGRHWEILFKSQNCMLPYFCRDVQIVCGIFLICPMSSMLAIIDNHTEWDVTHFFWSFRHFLRFHATLVSQSRRRRIVELWNVGEIQFSARWLFHEFKTDFKSHSE